MHGQDFTTSPFSFTSPIDPQVREQLEQLRSRYPHERLPIAVFVLAKALDFMPVAPLAREQAAQLLATLRTHRALPPCNAGWTMLCSALNQLAAWYNGNSLLGRVVERSCQELASYACAAELVQAGLSHEASHDLFTAPVDWADSEWTPLFDGQRRLREELTKYPWVSAVWLFAEQQRALVEEHPVLRNRIRGAERFCPLPEHMIWRISSDATPYVEADLSRSNCDWTRCTVILPGDERLPIAVQQAEYVQWAYDRVQDSYAEWQRSRGGHVYIENSAINSPGAIQVIGSAEARVNSPETVPPTSPGPDAPAGPASARAEPPTETAASADPPGMQKPSEAQDPVDQKEVADAVPEAPREATADEIIATKQGLPPNAGAGAVQNALSSRNRSASIRKIRNALRPKSLLGKAGAKAEPRKTH